MYQFDSNNLLPISEVLQDLESELSSSKTQIADCKNEADDQRLDSIIQSGRIPQYGPTRGDRCLSERDDQTGKYTMQYSIESINEIKYQCQNSQGQDTYTWNRKF